MKSVLISIKPKWVEKITSGKKTIEVRKTAPKETPFKAYIYCTKPKNKWSLCDYEGAYQNSEGEIVYAQQHIIGEFVCDKVYLIKNQGNRFVVANEAQGVTNEIARQSCLDYYDMDDYLDNKDGYGLHISDLKIYGKPKELSEFYVHKKVKGGCKNCAYYRTPTLEFCQDCKSGKQPKKYLTRPPQSWMYVEKLENEQRTAY